MYTDLSSLTAVKRYKELALPGIDLHNFIELASEVCEAGIAVISLVDDNEETIIAAKGTCIQSIPLAKSFSLNNLLQNPILTIADVANHKRFANEDLAMVAPQMRFYAGAVLMSPEGSMAGRLYVIDKKPKQLNKAQENCLQLIAKQVIQYLEQQVSLLSVNQQLEKLKSHHSVTSQSELLLVAFSYR